MAKDSGTYAELHAWKGPLMRACRAGQIDDVVAILEKQLDDDAEDDNYRLLQDLLYSAARGGQVDMLEWLLDEHPEYPKREYDLTPLHYAIFSDNQNAFQVYKALIRRFPALKEWDLGHMGDPLGVVAVSNDVPFATFLLENGADATRAHYLKFPAVRFMKGCQATPPPPMSLMGRLISSIQGLWLRSDSRPRRKDFSDMIKLLESHGAGEAPFPDDFW